MVSYWFDVKQKNLTKKIETPTKAGSIVNIRLIRYILTSWNFRHIVRFDKIRSFNAVNIENGYKRLDIYSPREVTSYGND